MRVGFLIDRWVPERGGAERALARLAKHLDERGHDVHAFGLAASDGAPGTFHAVSARGLTRARREEALGHALVAAAREAGCERTIGVRHLPEVDLYWPHGGAHARSLEARRLSRGRAAGEPWGRHRVFLAFERMLLAEGGARRVACVSALVREELAELYPACRERLELVPNAVDLDAFRPENRASLGRALRAELGVAERTALIAFAARDPVLKGLPALLLALEPLQAQPWHLLIAGPRPASPWERLVRRTGIEPERATVRAEVDPRALFGAADLTALPTWRDTSSFVVLESLASGTPVLTTARAGAAEAIRSSVQGEALADPGNVEILSAALGRWIGLVSERAVDRLGVRAAVEDRGVGPWLDRLSALATG